MIGDYNSTKDLWSRLKSESRPVLLYGIGNGADKIFDTCSNYGIEGELGYGICKSNSMDFNCSNSNNRYENYRISMVLMGVFVTINDMLNKYEE